MQLLHEHRVTHRSLTADRILLTDDDQVMLLDPGDGDVAASDLQVRLDLAQLLAELRSTSGRNGPPTWPWRKRARTSWSAWCRCCSAWPGPAPPGPNCAARACPARAAPAAAGRRPGREVSPARLERIRIRSLVTLVASVAAAYLLAGELARESLGHVLRMADWRWGLVALALSAATYVGAALELSGFVSERLRFTRTLLAQLAGSFVTLVTPAASGAPRSTSATCSAGRPGRRSRRPASA